MKPVIDFAMLANQIISCILTRLAQLHVLFLTIKPLWEAPNSAILAPLIFIIMQIINPALRFAKIYSLSAIKWLLLTVISLVLLVNFFIQTLHVIQPASQLLHKEQKTL